VTFEDLMEINPVQLIAGQNQLVIVFARSESMEMLADGVGRSLKPVGIRHRLLGCEHFNEAFRKWVEPVRVSDVMIQGRRVELRQHKNFLQTGVEAVADRDINQPVLSSERHRGFGAIFREGK